MGLRLLYFRLILYWFCVLELHKRNVFYAHRSSRRFLFFISHTDLTDHSDILPIQSQNVVMCFLKSRSGTSIRAHFDKMLKMGLDLKFARSSNQSAHGIVTGNFHWLPRAAIIKFKLNCCFTTPPLHWNLLNFCAIVDFLGFCSPSHSRHSLLTFRNAQTALTMTTKHPSRRQLTLNGSNADN